MWAILRLGGFGLGKPDWAILTKKLLDRFAFPQPHPMRVPAPLIPNIRALPCVLFLGGVECGEMASSPAV